MIFRATEIRGVIEIAAEPRRDARGFFARIYCPQELAEAGIDFVSTQINLSSNEAAFTLRGMHWQDPPYAEAKIVRVVAGAVHDVVIDLRPDSPTYLRWIARRLDAEQADALLVPEGCAHGFLTLLPRTDVLYQMSRTHVAGHARGLRYDDPAIGIKWPAPPKVIADADLAWPCPWTPSAGLRRVSDG